MERKDVPRGACLGFASEENGSLLCDIPNFLSSSAAHRDQATSGKLPCMTDGVDGEDTMIGHAVAGFHVILDSN